MAGLLVFQFVERGVGKLRLQGREVLLPLVVRWLFAPLAAVAHPSAHVALVTRPPSSEQSGSTLHGVPLTTMETCVR